MTAQKSLNNFINAYQNKVLVSLFITLGIVSLVFTSLIGIVSIQNSPSKISQASGVYICATGETLSGANCLSTPITFPIYTETCENGYTVMDSVCVTFVQKVCTDYTEGVIDTVDPTLCKFNNINNVLLSEITDNDGRQCKGVGYNFKRYNVGLATTSTAGPIMCSSAISGVSGKANFRFVPRSITSVKNFVTNQTATSTPICQNGYTLTNSQCVIAAKVASCSLVGEYLDSNTSTCKTCPANKYCLNSTTGETTASICPNGGTLINNLCISANKIATTTYVDGCTSTYVRYDQTCTIEEIRTHDIDACSYYYNSDHINTLAVVDTSIATTSLNRCSTGGSADFDNNSITKVSDLQCNGAGTAWYNYNVAYDPLVCGNTYDVNNKSAFRWSAKSFTKIVGLQKIGFASTVCPSGWVAVANSENCSQALVVQRFALVGTCPAGSFAPTGSAQLSDCVTSCLSSSSSSSTAQQNVFFNINLFAAISANAQTMTACSSSSSLASSSSSVFSISAVQGGGVIIITNQSSSMLSSSSSIQQSTTKIEQCILKSNQYRENSECKTCPDGTVVISSNPVSIRDCVTIVNVEKPTIRTGGSNDLQNLTIGLSLFVLSLALIKVKKYQYKFISNWFKVK